MPLMSMCHSLTHGVAYSGGGKLRRQRKSETEHQEHRYREWDEVFSPPTD